MKHPRNASLFLYGKHACIAALANQERQILRLCVTENTLRDIAHMRLPKRVETLQTRDFDKVLRQADLPHQGIALEVMPLESPDLRFVIHSDVVVVLDQITDPHNVGAILRSCAAFDVHAVICPKDHAPSESGALAKAASGALEIVPICKVTNLARTLEDLKKEGYWIVGLDGQATTTLAKANTSGKIALVMGAEGKGLRKLTRDHCDLLVRLPISNKVESLNVSNATAIALYQLQGCL